VENASIQGAWTGLAGTPAGNDNPRDGAAGGFPQAQRQSALLLIIDHRRHPILLRRIYRSRRNLETVLFRNPNLVTSSSKYKPHHNYDEVSHKTKNSENFQKSTFRSSADFHQNGNISLFAVLYILNRYI